jgi:hypothetical protein
MKSKFVVAVLLFVTIAAAGFSQPLPSAESAASTGAKALTGIWRGQGIAQEAGSPFVTLTLNNEGGSLSGAILFSVVHLEQGKPVASAPGVPEPILNPRFDGQILQFQMRYRGPLPTGISSGDPLLTCHLKLSPPDRAEFAMGKLVTDAEQITGSPLPLGPPIQMVRSAN